MADSHWPEWTANAACRQTGVEGFFVEQRDDLETPKRVCGRCEVRSLCLDWVMGVERGMYQWQRHGVVGGLSAPERGRYEETWLKERGAA